MDDNVIRFSELYLEQMQTLVHTMDELKAEGYQMEPFSAEEIEGLKRCKNCHSRLREKKETKKEEEDLIIFSSDDEDDKEAGRTEQEKKPQCRFHPGTVVAKRFTCCNGFYLNTPGCVSQDGHTPREYAAGELEDDWKLHRTPTVTAASGDIRTAVALDCEMGTSFAGDSELIRVSLIDYFSGEILVDSLVYPKVAMQHFNTRYSGVNRGMLEVARQDNQCLTGRDDAREQLWKYVGPDTVVIVHGGKTDLLALRWIHGAMIDTYVVEGAREMGSEKRSLKHLAAAMLGRRIQAGEHDSVEDARACRGVVHWYVENGL